MLDCRVFRKSSFFTEHLIDSLNGHFLQEIFVDRTGVADVAGGLQPTAASPDNGFAATVVPANAPEEFTAFTAENHLGKTVIAGVAAPFTILSGMNQPSSCKFLLHQKEDVLRNDCFVIALHVITSEAMDDMIAHQIEWKEYTPFHPYYREFRYSVAHSNPSI